MFVPDIFFQPRLMFVNKDRAYPSGDPLWGRLLALPENIRLAWKRLPGKNTLFYDEN
jgi:hypothetical protein